MIRVKEPSLLDYEEINMLNFTIVAREMVQEKPKESRANIQVHIRDVNDNPPRFTRLHSINVTENTAIGTNLLKVETVDLDSPENAQVQYKFISNPDEAFAIHEKLGDISIAKNLDREIR